MTTPFLGEIQIFGFQFAPHQWAFANGTALSVTQNAALFSLLGTTYGGNGTTNFLLPNLVGRGPCNQGKGTGLTDRVIGETFGDDMPGGVDAVIIDIGLPDRKGDVLINEIRAIHPSLPIVLATGQVTGDLRQSLANERKISFLTKPYTAQGLLGALLSVGICPSRTF